MNGKMKIPSVGFSSIEKLAEEPTLVAAASKSSNQRVVISVYQTKINGHCHLITITWSKKLLVHTLSISVEEDQLQTKKKKQDHDHHHQHNQWNCKVELRPWFFWRKLSSKLFHVDNKPVHLFWDLRRAKFSGEPEPLSGYYVALVSDNEVVLLLGDHKTKAYKHTGFPPSLTNAALVSRREHVFGKRKLATRAQFHDKGKFHEILIQCNNGGGSNSSSILGGDIDSEMVIKIDDKDVLHVNHLHWKFRGNESIFINKTRLEVYWDVHDWLFVPGLRRALFIFRPVVNNSICCSASSSSSSSLSSLWSSSLEGSCHAAAAAVAATTTTLGDHASAGSNNCLFLYAWKLE